jgi:predicted KAP-like P-loop ATPase
MEPDQPILSSKEDRFGRKQFAHRIADVIATRDPNSGIVVGIHGPWGEGKTSVLNMIAERLVTYDEVLVIRFNPWRFPEESLLLRSFFFQIAREIDASLLTKKEKLSSKVLKYADALGVVPYAEKMVGPFKVVLQTQSNVDLDALKDRLKSALRASKKRIVVMMDDIDRLDKAEIHTVFRLVKLLGDFPNTTYVLFFDEERVAEALGEKYVGAGGGKSFLEKIIQVPLSLPPASRHARRAIAIEGLEAALALAKFEMPQDDARRLGEVFDKGFMCRLTTPRVAK